MSAHQQDNCRPDLIVAYVDGELESAARVALEQHIVGCETCDDELRMQRRFMCELDSAFNHPVKLDVPENFAQVVAVHAQSDMRGARSGKERWRALAMCLLLALGGFALVGAAAGRSVLITAQLLAIRMIDVAGLLGKALYDAAAGLSVVLRVAGGALLPDAFAVLILLLLVLAVLLLTILIAAYHRYPNRGLYE